MKFGRVKNYPWYQEAVSVLCLLSVLYSVWAHYSQLPDRIATHFDWNGVPNGWGSKGFTLALLLGLVLMEWGIDTAVSIPIRLIGKAVESGSIGFSYSPCRV